MLKIKTARRYLKNLGVTAYENFIGFRYDESSRVINYGNRFDNVVPAFPLYDRKIIKADVNEYWRSKPYKLEIPAIFGNCDLCFLKGKNAILLILQKHPEWADKWIKDERSGTFIKGTSYQQLLDMSKNQTRLFDIDQIEPAFSCACNNF